MGKLANFMMPFWFDSLHCFNFANPGIQTQQHQGEDVVGNPMLPPRSPRQAPHARLQYAYQRSSI